MRRPMRSSALATVCLAAALASLGGCGQGNGGDGNDQGTTLSGRVVDAASPQDGVADAYVYVVPRGSMRQGNTIGATTDANGNVRLEHIPPGAYSIVVMPPEDSAYQPVEVFADMSGTAHATLRVTDVTDEAAAQITTVVMAPVRVDLEPGASQTFTATVTDAEGNALSLAPTWVVTGGIGTISSQGRFTAGSTAGTGMVAAAVGGRVATAQVSVGGAPSNQPPTLGPLLTSPAPPFTPGQVVTIQASPADPDGDVLYCAWFSLGAATTGSGATISWTAPTAPGAYAATCVVLDGNGGVANRAVSLPVGGGNRPPVLGKITANPGLTVGLGAHLALTAVATDQDGDNLAYVWLGPDGSIVGTGPVIGLTAPDSPMLVTYTCIVSDPNGGSDSQTVAIEATGDTDAGTGRRVAWVSALADQSDVYVGFVNGAGTPVNLSHSPAVEVLPALSADNSVVAWTKQESSGDYEIYVAPADGSGAPVNISQDPSNDDTSPSVDASGTTVVWLKGARVEVYAAPADGAGTPRNLSNTPAVASWDASISGDGLRVAWAEGGNLVVASAADGGDLVSITGDADLAASRPALNYDGTIVAWESGQQIYVADVVAGATPTRVDAGTGATHPSISDDGTRVAWIALGAGNATSALVADVGSAGGPRELASFTRGEVVPSICLSPEGGIAAWDGADTSGSNYDIYIGATDGSGTPVNLTNDGTSAVPSLQGN